MTDDELVTMMFNEYWRGPMDNQHHKRMRAALAIARPIIEREALEKAIIIIEEIRAAENKDMVGGGWKEEDFEWNAPMTEAVASIRALMEQP